MDRKESRLRDFLSFCSHKGNLIMKTENKHQWIKIIAAVIVIFLLWGVKAGQSGEEKISEKDIQSEETEAKESVEEGLSDRIKIIPGYIAGLEYDDGMTMQGSGSYACWKDILILGNTVYRLENDVYKRTGELVYDLFGLFPLENTDVYGKIRQYENLIMMKKVNTFLICDLDTEPYSCYEYEPSVEAEGGAIDPYWYIYEGELLYWSKGEDGISSLWAYNLESREEERIDTWTESEVSAETTGYEEIKCQETCGDSLFFFDNSRKIYGNGGIFMQGVLGESRETGIGRIDGIILTAKGYFRYDGKKELIFYDLDGNERASYQIREEELGEEYCLQYLIYDIYDRGRLLCFYENQETRQLHINQVSIELPDFSEEGQGLSYWLEEGAERISVTPGEEQGNILGYTLRREANQMQYIKEPDWLVKNSSVGKGIFRSEHMSENSVFLGEILKDILERRKISKGNKQYFSGRALDALEITEEEWEILRQGQKTDASRYDCFYRINRVFGVAGYDFFYRFYSGSVGNETEQEKTLLRTVSEVEKVSVIDPGDEEGNWEADVRVTVDQQGIIRDIQVDVNILPEGINTCYGRQQGDFFQEEYEESVIRNGEAETGKIVIDYGKYWQQHMEYDKLLKKLSEGPGGLLVKDAAESGETIGRIVTDVLESKGENTVLYGELFESDYDFYLFQKLPWEKLSEDWKSDGDYDCYFSDMTEKEGCIKLCYYIYPEFGEKQEAEGAAQAVIFEVKITDKGKLADTALQVVFLTKEERMAARKKEGNRLALLQDGEDTGAGVGIRITDSLTEEVPVLLNEYCFDEDAAYGNKKRNTLSLWECYGATEIATYVGDALLEDLNEKKIESGLIKELLAGKADGEKREEQVSREQKAMLSDIEDDRKYAGNKWRGDEKYDCYYVRENEQNGCLHLKYYFYRNKPFEGKLRNIIADVYISERGIEDIETSVLISGEEWREKIKKTCNL